MISSGFPNDTLRVSVWYRRKNEKKLVQVAVSLHNTTSRYTKFFWMVLYNSYIFFL
jgi:hypothetical protein